MKKILSLCLACTSISLYADATHDLDQRLNTITSMTGIVSTMQQVGTPPYPLNDGVLSIQKPNQMNWQVTNPSKILYIANGSTLWTIDQVKNTAIATKLQNNLSDLITQPLLFLSEPTSFIDANFNVTEIGSNALGFHLTPKNTNSGIQIVDVFFSANNVTPFIIEIDYSSGQKNTATFYQVKINPTLDPKIFNYIPSTQ